MNEISKKYTTLNNLYEITSLYPVMSDGCDQLVEISIFQFFEPRNIIEFGAATGNWCILMNHFCKEYINQHYMLVDDFSWSVESKYKKFKEEYKFPLNKIELEKNLFKNLKSFEIVDITIDDIENISLEEPVDLVRIDCDPHNEDKWNNIINWIDQNGSENLIVLSDDISSTVAPHRLLLIQQLVSLNKLKLIWIGKDSAAWCRPSMYNKVPLWQDFLKSGVESELLTIQNKNLSLYSYENSFLLTRKNNLYNYLIDGLLYNQQF